MKKKNKELEIDKSENENLPEVKENETDFPENSTLNETENYEQNLNSASNNEAENLEFVENEEEKLFERLKQFDKKEDKKEDTKEDTNKDLTEDNIVVNENKDTGNINYKNESVDISLNDFISGYVLLVIYDRIYPKILRYILKLFKIEIPEVHLDEDEAAVLEPLADKIAGSLTLKVNPLLAFFVLSNIFYLNKIDETGYFEKLKAKPVKKRGRPKKNKEEKND